MGVYGVDDPRHQDREDDVAVKVASLRDSSGDDSGAGGSKGTLNRDLWVVLSYTGIVLGNT